MKSLLHSLEGSESVLLMYLFDELPDDDRAEVESMLRTDGGLRSQFEQLKAAHEATAGLIERADKDADKRSRSVNIAQRNAARLMTQWNVRQVLERPAPPRTGAVRKYLIYPAAGIAAIMMIGLILWGLFAPTPTTIDYAVNDPSLDPHQQDALIALQRSLADEGEVPSPTPVVDLAGEEMLVRSLDTSEDLIMDAQLHRHISDAERQLVALTRLSEERDIR